MNEVINYLRENKEQYLQGLFDYIRIPSISSLPEHREDMYRTANFLKQWLLKAGADKAEVYPTKGNPVAYAEKIIDPTKPTVLIYGHYDVMPVDPLSLWESEPFEPVIRDRKIFARGADDDKGQVFIQLAVFDAMVKTGSLPCNVKFMIEGEEEIGSPSLSLFCEENKEMLKADIFLISDTAMISKDIPSITVGLRGLCYMEVEVTGPDHDLHSGLFGGAVANPANELAKIIAKLTDEKNRICIPGFYDDVLEVSKEERAEMAKAPFNLEKYKKQLYINEVCGEEGYTTPERTGIRPTLDVNGIWGGYIGKGSKTVLPSKATAKISMRLVPNQDYEKVAVLFEKYIREITPPYVKVKVTAMHGGYPYVSPIDIPAYKAAVKAIEKTFGVLPVPFHSGGSIPIVSTFEKVIGVKSILMGFGLETDATHSPNENFDLDIFYKGMETVAWFYHYFTE
jgi:acetylornithine deacetylase/succinyl-diaminopimelate desuccinylase-like protein